MTKQLNVRSDYAHNLATRLAKRMNMTTTRVVETALETLAAKHPGSGAVELNPEQRAEHEAFMELVRAAHKHIRPDDTFTDHDLYDEYGLPK